MLELGRKFALSVEVEGCYESSAGLFYLGEIGYSGPYFCHKRRVTGFPRGNAHVLNSSPGTFDRSGLAAPAATSYHELNYSCPRVGTRKEKAHSATFRGYQYQYRPHLLSNSDAGRDAWMTVTASRSTKVVPLTTSIASGAPLDVTPRM